MRRYWISKNQIVDKRVEIVGEEYHHIVDVCRQTVGSKFEVITEDAKAYFVEIETLNKKNVIAKVLEERKITPLKKPHIYLVVSVPKFQTFEVILEKCVELGVKSVLPVFSEFSFVKKEIPRVKFERWAKIVKSATQQSGRGDLMEIKAPESLDVFLKKFSSEDPLASASKLGVFAYEGDAKLSLRDRFMSVNSTALNEIFIFVGSEGGFSFTEVQKFKNIGMEPITLGDQVLRVETACLALVSVLKYEVGLW